MRMSGNRTTAGCLTVLIVVLVGNACRIGNPAALAQSHTHNDAERTASGAAAARLEVPGLDGKPVNPFGAPDAKAVALIFVSVDCPVANRYAPEIQRLSEMYRSKKVAFWLVYADPAEDAAKIRQHLKEYRYQIPAVRDPDHRLVKLCQVTKTPEAVVFVNRKQVYRGRIDDRNTDYGKDRKAPSREDFREAIDDVLRGKPVRVAVTKAIGCFIPELDR